MDKVTAILLAAGMSRRMGKNKLLLDYHGKPMAQHALDTLRASEADDLIVVTSKISIEPIREFLPPGILLINNPDYESGMTSSIQAGVSQAQQGNGYMICLADQPLITTENYNTLLAAWKEKMKSDEKAIVLPAVGGRKGNPVIFSPFYRELILSHKEPEGCKEIVQQHSQHVFLIDLKSEGILRDVDTPESYRKITGKK